MSLWNRMFGKSDAKGPKPGSDRAAAGTPLPPANSAAGANTARPPTGAATLQPPSAAQPKPPKPDGLASCLRSDRGGLID